MKNLLLQLFTWWNGATMGTRFFTRRHGQRVGEDQFGNTYYQTADRKRRWVIYNGYAEGSAVPPGWYGWLHYTADQPPVNDSYTPRDWQKPHQPNPTGTPRAYRPPGSLVNPHPQAQGEPSYTAWTPK
ncbi:MAG: NADH:ubiquinone oxidoreductase subunit NDUFA12 [Hyphomicrobiales bacterium]